MIVLLVVLLSVLRPAGVQPGAAEPPVLRLADPRGRAGETYNMI